MKKKYDESDDDKKNEQREVATLTNSYLMVDPNKLNGVLPRLYNFTDYNNFSKPTEDIDMGTGGITPSNVAIPDPIVGKRIQLPDGDTTVTALGWAASGEQDSGLNRIGTNNYGEYVNSTLVYDWNASRLKLASNYCLYLGATGDIVSPGTDTVAIQQTVNDALRWSMQNQSSGTSAHSVITLASDDNRYFSFGLTSSTYSVGGDPRVSGEGFIDMSSPSLGGTARPFFILNRLNSYLRFGTNDTERMRILSGGGLVIGATAMVGAETLRVNGSVYFNSGLTINTGGETINAGDLTATSSNAFFSKVVAGSTSRTITNGAGQFYAAAATQCQLFFDVNDQAANNKLWDINPFNTTMQFRVINDANTVATNYMEVGRSGTTVSYVSFPNSNVGIGTTGPDRKLDVLDTSGPQLRLTYTDNSVYTDFQTTSGGVLNINPSGSSVTISNTLGVGQAVTGATILGVLGSETIASGASATWNGFNILTASATLTGSTNITTSTGFNLFQVAQPTISAASALTVTNAATLAILGQPVGGGAGPATITNAYSLWVQNGNCRFDGQIFGKTGSASSPSYSIVGQPTDGMYSRTATILNWSIGGTNMMELQTNILQLPSTGLIGFNSSTLGSGSIDTYWSRAAAGVMALLNSSTAQTLRIYGTTTGPKYVSLSHDGTNGLLDVAASSGNLTIGGTNASSITTGVKILVPGGTAGAPTYGFTSQTDGMYSRTATILNWSIGGTNMMELQTNILQLPSTGLIGFNSSTLGSGSIDTYWSRGGAGIMELKNSTTAQTLRVYGTTSGSKYSILKHDGTDGTLDVSSGKLILGGTASDIQWGKALVALGAGGAATLGNTGGSGPATTTQNTWLQLKDSAGNTCWVPVWK